jgi:hypothetical protein
MRTSTWGLPLVQPKLLLAAAVALLALPGLFAACRDQTDEAMPGAAVSAGQIIENPSQFAGQTVTVTGAVEDLFGPRAFTLDSGLNVGELLVLGADPFPQVPDNATMRAYVVDDTATVTGTVRTLVTAEVERELGWNLEPQIVAKFERQPVLVAARASFLPRSATPSPTASAPASATASATSGMPGEVQDFVQFVQGTKKPEPGLDHEYTSTGMQRLTAALTALANRAELSDQNLTQKREVLTQRIAGLQQDPASLKHADMTRQAFMAAADLMSALQQKGYPQLSAEVTQVRQAASTINPQQPLLQQITAVETFFQRASTALQAMTQPTR